MNHKEFIELLQKGESDKLEFKQKFSDAVIETLVAFANTFGGIVIVGVSDKGVVHPLEIGKETIQKWINEIKNKTQPSIIPSYQIVSYQQKNVVLLSVQEFPVKPLSFKGRYYKRVENSNHQLSASEITEMNLGSLQLSWDAYLVPNKSIEDLDVEKINKFISKVNASRRFQLPTQWRASLQKLRLIENDKITNAAFLLFSKEDIPYNVHLGRFKTPSMIIDDKMLNGTLFEVVEDSMNYIIGHIKVAFEITGKTTQRTEIFEYPLPALREIVLNAIIHRDYMSSIDVQIKIFDQKITFFNPGNLYGSLNVELLKKDNYQAFTRNKLIAEAFYLTGDIEKYGSGFVRIREEIKAYPTMEFTFEEMAKGFLVDLHYSKQDDVAINYDDKVTDRVTDKVTDNLTVNQQEILKQIKINKYISTSFLADKIGVSKRKIIDNINKIRELGIVSRVGSPKGGYWEIRNLYRQSRDVEGVSMVNEDTDKVTDKVTNKVTNKVTDKVTDNLSKNQQEIIKQILLNQKVSATQLADCVGISKRKIIDNMNKLKGLGLVERVGSAKNGYWKINL